MPKPKNPQTNCCTYRNCFSNYPARACATDGRAKNRVVYHSHRCSGDSMDLSFPASELSGVADNRPTKQPFEGEVHNKRVRIKMLNKDLASVPFLHHQQLHYCKVPHAPMIIVRLKRALRTVDHKSVSMLLSPPSYLSCLF